MEGLIEGRIVHYVLTEDDVKRINDRRTDGMSIAKRIGEDKWPLGAQAHIGNQVSVGQHFPMIIVRVWNQEPGCVNGQVLLDGCDTFWVCSKVPDGEFIGNFRTSTWHWIERS
jgi:hypothetical protein